MGGRTVQGKGGVIENDPVYSRIGNGGVIAGDYSEMDAIVVFVNFSDFSRADTVVIGPDINLALLAGWRVPWHGKIKVLARLHALFYGGGPDEGASSQGITVVKRNLGSWADGEHAAVTHPSGEGDALRVSALIGPQVRGRQILAPEGVEHLVLAEIIKGIPVVGHHPRDGAVVIDVGDGVGVLIPDLAG